MPEVIVVAVVKPKEGQEQAVERACAAMLVPTHQEEGCLTYALHRDTRTPGQLVFVERWASSEALGAHTGTDRFKALVTDTAEMLREPLQIMVLEPVAGGDPTRGMLFPA